MSAKYASTMKKHEMLSHFLVACAIPTYACKICIHNEEERKRKNIRGRRRKKKM
jgi:hypothetical protein